MKRATLATLLATAACNGPAEQADSQSNQSARENASAVSAAAPKAGAELLKAVAVAPDGVHIYDRQTQKSEIVKFGTAQDSVLKAVAFRGPARVDQLSECGAGPLEAASWRDGLTFYFQDQALAGWATGPRTDGSKNLATVVTTQGIGPGNHRTELERWYKVKVFESTLGEEFEADGIYGLFDGSGPDPLITNMWAGVSCNMR